MASTQTIQLAAGLGTTTAPSPPAPLLTRLPSHAAAGVHQSMITDSVSRLKSATSIPAGVRVRPDEDGAPEVPYAVSLSVPASPSGVPLGASIRRGDARAQAAPSETKIDIHPAEPSHSQLTMIKGADGEPPVQCAVPRSTSTRDRRFDQFKTFSGRLERQLSSLRGMPPQEPADIETAESNKISEEEADGGEVPTADRYFAALEGPELDTLRATEVAVLPKDERWPFLLRFPISAFGMCLGVTSQAMLWKTLATEPSTAFLGVSPDVNHALWWLSVALMVLVSAIYLLKVVFYFEAVRREFHHPIRVNFFFAPWIACLFLVKGSPRPVWTIHHVVWFLLMAPIFLLDLKIYGQWMSGGERRLSKVANPSNHLAIVGNFVGALLGARMGLREGPIFFFAVGLVHYIVLFVTLYQRLPTNVQLPKELHPVFFLFIAAPSVASMAWARLRGEFDMGARVAYFVALFLFMSLAVRANMFRGIRFSLAWWAYTFPMTSAAIATVLYASEVTTVATRSLAVGLSGIATVTVTGVLATTVYHAFVRKDLFPNDVSIAITRRKPKFSKILAHLRSSGADVKELVFSFSSKNGASDSDDSASAVSKDYSNSSGDQSPMTRPIN
uniref:S-type anion channel SLAH2 n=1 Tax=Oryza brachyantha TaxID=4533 RepID=J3MA65_ORYBR